MAEQQHQFQAEVSKLLNLVVNSLYSNKEIFLRELISNASDACDKLRYLALTKPELLDGMGAFRIDISTNKRDRTITIADNGIGMSHDELIENLGTIARSGTTEFFERLTGDEQKDAALIGQFGVGFYASFSVAKQVDVVSRKAGEKEAWMWSSEGTGEFTLTEAEKETHGTTITVHLAKGESEYLEEERLRHIVRTYSDHISIPIIIATKDGDSQMNAGSAIWTRSKSDITPEQYAEFYHHVGHAFDQPWLTLHNRAEGKIEYTNLLFVPSSPPFDLMNPERKHRVKLYVKRVFVTDDCEGLMPGYLRFVRGIVDSEDLPLNVSREMLQHNVVVDRIRKALIKRVFGELKKKAEKAPEEYTTFWTNFGAVLKEGLYEDQENREPILELARFRSSTAEGLTSIAEYVERMKDGQSDIYYIIGDDGEQLAKSPQLEGFRSRGLEVLLLSDPIDEFWVPMVGEFGGKPLKSVTSGDIDLSTVKKEEADEAEKPESADDADLAKLILALKESLGDAVKDVRSSDRLTDSAVCLVSDSGDMDLHLERMLKRQGQMQVPTSLRIMEINPTHSLIKKLSVLVDNAAKRGDLQDMAQLLLDQARIAEGETLSDPIAFAQRLNTMMERGL
ncbi:MAG: molecular chaperone HtpG [Proteobacteria bacterium]|nr:molecular chaperone HtpG [Pseudomonadota bacterium]